ncbi:4547_t:CDS:2, partial [Paraglomus occultum]
DQHHIDMSCIVIDCHILYAGIRIRLPQLHIARGELFSSKFLVQNRGMGAVEQETTSLWRQFKFMSRTRGSTTNRGFTFEATAGEPLDKRMTCIDYEVYRYRLRRAASMMPIIFKPVYSSRVVSYLQ